MSDISEHSEKLVAEVKRRAVMFCADNPMFKKQLVAIEAAMLIGVSVALEQNESDIHLQVVERYARRVKNKPHPNYPMPCCERDETRTSKCFTPHP